MKDEREEINDDDSNYIFLNSDAHGSRESVF